MTLEEKIVRLKEIQSILANTKPSLGDSIKLLEEANKLKESIDTELGELENKVVQLTHPQA